MALLSGSAGFPLGVSLARGNVSEGVRTALGDQGGDYPLFDGRSSVPRGSSFQRASSLQARPSPYPTQSISAPNEDFREATALPARAPSNNTALLESMHVQHQQVDTEMDPLLAEVNKLINDLSFEPALPLTRSEFTDVSLDTIRLMARADDFIKDGIFKDMVPEFIDTEPPRLIMANATAYTRPFKLSRRMLQCMHKANGRNHCSIDRVSSSRKR